VVNSGFDLTGKVTAPVTGAAPVTTMTDTAQYTGTVEWQISGESSVSGNFAAGTVYQAVVTLTAKSGYTFTGVAANSFTHTGAVPGGVSNGADSGVVTITFPVTEYIIVSLTNLTDKVTAPVTGAAPDTTAIDTDQYMGTVAWQTSGGSPVSGNFAAGTVYQAVVTLDAQPDYTFTGVAANSFTHDGATTVAFDAESGVVTITFPETDLFATPALYRTMVPLTGGTIVGNNSAYDSNRFPSGRTVILSPFKIAAYETTYELWYEVKTWAGTHGYTFYHNGREGNDGSVGAAPTGSAKTEPVTGINWRDAIVWCNAYSEMSGKEPVYYYSSAIIKDSRNNTACNSAVMDTAKNGYRLPTEAEWEYAARGGGTPATTGSFVYTYAGSNAAEDVAWHSGNSSGSTHPVGGKTANTAGLYDMSGNVWEWCWDWWGDVSSGTETDPTGPASGSGRVIQGGCWDYNATYCAVAYQYYHNPSYNVDTIGFRVVSP
jgi:formylglycine-generating enzyme required for sulfatase activity